MPASKLMTAEELSELPEETCRYELLRGKLISLPFNSAPHGYAAAKLCGRIGDYLEDHPIGTCYAGGVGCVLARDPDTVRGADLAVMLGERDRSGRTDWYFEDAPDLVIELISIWDEYSYIMAKALDFIAAGTRLFWIVDPQTRTGLIFTLDQQIRLLHTDDELDGGEVLPGFRVRVGELFG